MVDTPTVSDNSPEAGARFTLSATVRNQGDGASPSATLRYYQSADATITTSDTQTGTDSVSRLSALASGNESISLTAPATAGTYYYGACVDAVSDETDTANNCSVAVAVTVGGAGAPDLVVESIEVDNNSPFGGTTFALTAGIRNRGDASSVPTTRRFYRSVDSTITASDTQVGTNRVSGLQASGLSEIPISLTAPSSPGTYYYGACVDAVPSESNVNNNCSTAVTVTVPQPNRPDLIVSSATVSDTTPDGGSSFTLEVRVRNRGDGASPSATLRYYQSADATITTSDTQTGTDSVSRLDASASGNESISLTAPATPGTYYYGACVDAVSEESNTANNCSSAVTVTVAADQSPDLIVSAISSSDKSPVAGSWVTLSATVRNRGDASSGSTTLRFYRSADATITTADTKVGFDRTVTSLVSSAVTSISDRNQVTVPGTYYYGACVESVQGESDGDNNCSDSVAVTFKPDMYVGSITAGTCSGVAIGAGCHTGWDTGTSFNRGDSFKLTVTAHLYAVEDATSWVRFFQSTDSTVTSSDIEVAKWGPFKPNGNAYGVWVDVTAPSSAGTYYYAACVDAVPSESNKANNCSAALRVTIVGSAAPDLAVDTPTVDDSTPTAGASITLSATVRNEGDGSAASTTLRYFRSTDSTITSGDTEVGTDSVSGLASSGTAAESIDLTAPSSAGTYYYGACVDSVSDESDTTNNCSSAVAVTVSAATAPGAPTGLTATADGQTEIDLSWTAPSEDGGADITGYKIEVSTDGSSWTVLVANTKSTSTSYSHTGLTEGSTRHYRVSAINSAGTGAASGSASATTDSASTPAPTPAPPSKGVTGSITSCEGEQVAPGVDSYEITIKGTVTANRDVRNVRVEGTFDSSFVGIDLLGDMDAGDTANFSVTGIVSEAVGTCGAEIEWLEIN